MGATSRKRVRVVWAPNSEQQRQFLASSVPDVFYGGQRGGGKTDGLIGDFISHEKSYGKRAKGFLARRTMDELEEVQLRCKKYLHPMGWECTGQKPTWRSPSGAFLKLRYLEHDEDAERYQGHEHTWLGIDEAGNFPSPGPIDLLRATLRGSPSVPKFVRLTGNPGGRGHAWLKRRYIDPSPPGVPFKDEAARTWRIFIPSSWRNNPAVDAAYEDRLYAATIGKPWLRKNWMEGDWDALPDIQPFQCVHYHAGRGFEDLRLIWCIDAAYTKKKHSDFTASGIWGADSERHLFELMYWEKQANAQEKLDHIFSTMELWQPRGLEVLNIEAHIDWAEKILPQEMTIRNFDFAVNSLKSHGVPKDDRIRDNIGRRIDDLFFQPGSKLAAHVLGYVGGKEVNGEPDDGPDCLAYLIMESERQAKDKLIPKQYNQVTAYKIKAREALMRGSPSRGFEVVR